MKRYISIILLWIAITVSLFAEDANKEVLVICPYRPSGTWGQSIVSPILAIEEGRSDLRFSCSVIRNSSMESVEDYHLQVEAIVGRFATHKPNMVVIYGPGNYRVAEVLNKKWKNIPILLIGELDYVCDIEYVVDSIARPEATRMPMESFINDKNVALLHTPVFCDETLDFINSMSPNLSELVFVGGEEFVSREIQLMMQRVTEKSGITFTPFLANATPFSNVEKYIKKMDVRKTSVLYCNWHRKHGTDATAPSEGGIRGVQAAGPTYNIYYTNMAFDTDVVGYVSYDYNQYVNQAKRIILEVLDGKTQPRDLGIVTVRRDHPVVNERAMLRYGLDESLIPSNVTVVNQKPTFWSRYMLWIFLLAVAALSGLSAFFYYLYQRQLQLHRTSSRYNLLVDNAPFEFSKAQLIFDAEGQIKDLIVTKANKRMSSRLQKRGLVVGAKTILEEYPLSGPVYIENLNKGRNAQMSTMRFTSEIKEFGLFYETLVLFDGPDFIHTFAINVTQQVMAQKMIEEAKEKAEKSDLIKTQFIQNMSHEIRTPMNAIVGFAQLLSLPDGFNTEDEKREYSEYIMNNAEILVMLIDDILDVTDMEHGNFNIALQDVNINQVCQKALKSVEHRVAPGVELSFHTDLDEGALCQTDPKRVQQVLINFLSNACKHTEKGEIRLECSTTENPGHITLSVADTGPGVPPEMADNIFERFTKLNSFKQGSGLGLNICKGIAEKLNAQVMLDTSYTDGARFVFII
ncbi:MAG: sensor histidine kinase [Bacteroidaceae bacterium]|nr:sensor histidine kinase [Bacteroidaceae bacterium]